MCVRVLVISVIIIVFLFFLMIRRPPRSTRTDTSFPTRRSSDLGRRESRGRRFPRTSGFMRAAAARSGDTGRSEEHTSELQSLMRLSYAVFCLKKKKNTNNQQQN